MAEIQTDVDKLVNLVREKKSVSVEEASSLLNLGQETVQKLAEFLEDEGIVEIESHLTKQLIIDKGVSKIIGSQKQKNEKVSAAPKKVLSERELFQEMLKHWISDVERHEASLKRIKASFESVLKNKDEISKIINKISNDVSDVKSGLNSIQQQFKISEMMPKFGKDQSLDKAKESLGRLNAKKRDLNNDFRELRNLC
ncbi:MAG: hypothetical protein NTV63_05255 [Candidatus Woesearchaeota archaeon]|nr:hypothetical protein [Candidatus Woesearchaeota archaeon]